jgi:hypothetical protein
MSKSESKKWINVVGRLLLAYALIFTQSALAGQNQKTKTAADSAQKAAAQQTGDKQSSAATKAKTQTEEVQGEASETLVAQEGTARDASHQGIKVHGHWTIEVRNPDGSVVTHREFENSLQVTGAGFLTTLLSRGNSVGYWRVDVGPYACNLPGINAPVSCAIIEQGVGQAASTTFFPNLLVSSTGSGITLSGSATAANVANITFALTYMYPCPSSVAPSSPCSGVNVNPVVFTQANVPTVGVTSGQTIAVTVMFTFS